MFNLYLNTKGEANPINVLGEVSMECPVVKTAAYEAVVATVHVLNSNIILQWTQPLKDHVVDFLQGFINAVPGVVVFNWIVINFLCWILNPFFYQDVVKLTGCSNNCWEILFLLYKKLFCDTDTVQQQIHSIMKEELSQYLTPNDAYTVEDPNG